MARGIALRTDYDGDALRALARSACDAKQARRLLSLSLIYDGGSRSEAARHGDAGLQPVRNRLLHYHVNGPLHDGRTLNSGAGRG